MSFQEVDVFTDITFKGNSVVDVLDGNELSMKETQTIANGTKTAGTDLQVGTLA